MDMKTEHGLSCKVFNYEDFVEHSPDVRRMVTAYIDKSGDKLTVNQTMDLFQMTVGHPTFFMWMAKKDGYGVGFMTAHGVTADDKDQCGMVHIGFIDPTVTKKESADIIALAMEDLFKWAERCQFKSVFITTSRNERPFDKLIGRFGFERMTTVYEKEIDHGRKREENSNGGEPGDSNHVRSVGRVPVEASQPAGVGPVASGNAGSVK